MTSSHQINAFNETDGAAFKYIIEMLTLQREKLQPNVHLSSIILNLILIHLFKEVLVHRCMRTQALTASSKVFEISVFCVINQQ
jgi:hypothetical protein